jgi:two-component system NarL family sensor kinase
VQISLGRLETGLQLAVRDDGIGFEPALNRQRPSLGLASMLERTRLVGGELDIESSPGHGTTVVAWVPLKGAST